MGKIEDIKIVLKNADKIYNINDKVTGSLKFEVFEKLKINSIYLNFIGNSYVAWKNELVSISYMSNLRLVQLVRNLLVKDQKDHYLEPNEYSFDFDFDLAEMKSLLPTSYDGGFGVISYNIHAVIDMPWKLDKKIAEKIFIINPNFVDLKPELDLAISLSKEKYIGCLFCKSEPITGTLSVKKGIYYVGENIEFSATIDNKTDKNMKHVFVNLIQIATYRCKKDKITKPQTVSKLKLEKKIGGKCFERWDNQVIKVKNLYPTLTKEKCSNLQIEYKLELYFGAEGFSLDETVNVPIVICTKLPEYTFKPFDPKEKENAQSIEN